MPNPSLSSMLTPPIATKAHFLLSHLAVKLGIMLFWLSAVRALSVHAAPPIRIMPLGNSITEGAEESLTYRYVLWRLLRDAGHSVDFVGTRFGTKSGFPKFPDFDQQHQGTWGISADAVLDEIGRWSRSARPDIVLVHLGTNDLASDNHDVDRTVKGVSSIIDTLRTVNPDVAIVLARIIPAYFDVKRYNEALSALADSLNTSRSPVVCADLFSALDRKSHFSDGLHPNDSGYVRMGYAWYSALRPLVVDTLRAVLFDPPEGHVVELGASIPLRVKTNSLKDNMLVDFFADTTYIGTDSVPPFEFRWSGAAEGEHRVSARARGKGGEIALSGPVRIDVGNVPPRAAIVAPEDGRMFPVGSNILVRAEASDRGGRVAAVDFFVDTILVLSDSIEPFEARIENVSAPDQVIKVRVTDNQGLSTWSPTSLIRTYDPAGKVFAEMYGSCVMEAENFTGNSQRNDDVNWVFSSTQAGYGGKGYMTVPDNTAGNGGGGWESACEISFQVLIVTPGTYSIAVRRRAPDDNDDSGRCGVDGILKSANTFGGSTTEWKWTRGPSLGYLEAGIRIIQIRRREDGFEIDRLMIADDPAKLPAEGATDMGPEESPVVSSTANTQSTIRPKKPVEKGRRNHR